MDEPDREDADVVRGPWDGSGDSPGSVPPPDDGSTFDIVGVELDEPPTDE